MQKDYEIPLCADCTWRPIDPETRKLVEGGLNIGERDLPDGSIGVTIYSTVDPRINSSFRLKDGRKSNTAIRNARDCTPLVQGLTAELGDMMSRIRRHKKTEIRCTIGDVLLRDPSLPDLLYGRHQEQT